jgi:excisionase family DNA binding protein
MSTPKSKPNARRVRRNGEVLTLAEAARFLRVSETDLVQLAESYDIPGRKIGSEWRFLKLALESWLGGPTSKERLLSHAGEARNDPFADEMQKSISRRRG